MLLHAVVQLTLDPAAVVVGCQHEPTKLFVVPGLHSVSLDRDSTRYIFTRSSPSGHPPRFGRYPDWVNGEKRHGKEIPVNTRAQSTWRAAALAASLLVALTAFTAAATAGPEKGRGRPLRHFQRVAQPQLRRPAPLRSLDAGQRPGGDGGRDHPAGTARCAAHQRVRLRRARHRAPTLFQDNYLSVAANGAAADQLPVSVRRAVEHRHPSGFDLNNNGYGRRARMMPYGFGFFPGQFGMAVYSQYPIDSTTIRTFQTFLWKDMPGAMLPDDPNTAAPADWYSPAELNVFRLSSKSHWDLPIQIGKEDGALPRQPPDATGLRRPGGSERNAKPRRDPTLGRLHHARKRRTTSMTTRASSAG